MNTFTSIILAIVIAFTTTISTVVVADTPTRPSSALRGRRSQEQLPRRHLLEDNSECVLYLKSIAYEDGSDEESWSCEFAYSYAKEHFGGRDIMDIFGISKEEIEAQNPVSGETVLRTTGARVEQRSPYSLDDRVTEIEDIILVVTDPSSVVFESLTEVDVRHHRRRLATRNTGVLKTLVLRPVAPNGAVVNLSAAQIQNDMLILLKMAHVMVIVTSWLPMLLLKQTNCLVEMMDSPPSLILSLPVSLQVVLG